MESRILAVDYGEKRIGLALSDPMRIFAKPYETIPNSGIEQLILKLNEIIREKQVGEVILGIPWGVEGNETPKTIETREILTILQDRLSVPVSGIDERYTTSDANDLLKEMGYDWKKSRTVIDAMAACLILKRYLERNTNGPTTT